MGMDNKKLRQLAALGDKGVDTSDAPELDGWERAEIGRFYRPVKKPVTIRLDADVIECFKRRYDRYQPAINKVLRDFCRSQGLLASPDSLPASGKDDSTRHP